MSFQVDFMAFMSSGLDRAKALFPSFYLGAGTLVLKYQDDKLERAKALFPSFYLGAGTLVLKY